MLESIIFAVYIAYALAAMIVMRWRPSPQVVLATMFLGWILLPVQVFPPGTITEQNFTVEYMGTALPSHVLITKASVVPIVILAGLAISMPRVFRGLRLNAADLGMAVFCLTPLLPWAAGRIDARHALDQVGYLMAAWGATWAVGRCLVRDTDGRQALVNVLIGSGLVLLPVAVLEGVRPASLYSFLYGPHPFQLEGADRYVGFRPLGFFEHGNQYGVWVAVAALAALYRCLQRFPRRGTDIAIAAVLTVSALASQSVGAIILMAAGGGWLILSDKARRWTVIGSAMLLAIGGAAYMSGKLPVERWAYHTSAGQSAVSALRSVGRLSLAYRVRRDQMALPIIFSEPLAGYGVWDWWRPMTTRPWGLPLLIAGQYGILSLIVLAVTLLAGSARVLYSGRSTIMALVVMIAAVDAWLNSFLYAPAILASAAAAMPLRKLSPKARSARDEEIAGPSADPEPAHVG